MEMHFYVLLLDGERPREPSGADHETLAKNVIYTQ